MDQATRFLRADNEFRTVAHALAERGYDTVSSHPYERGFWNRAVLHPRYGFSESWFRDELGPGPVVGWGLSDDVFLDMQGTAPLAKTLGSTKAKQDLANLKTLLESSGGAGVPIR